jgi:microcin C transport system substrate-binding protein
VPPTTEGRGPVAAQQPAPRARTAEGSRLGIPRWRAAQRQGRGDDARIPRQQGRRRAHGVALGAQPREARHHAEFLATVDFALYQERLDRFEFDITTINFPGTNNPGQQLLEIFGSKAAKTESSGNYMGVSTPAVDALLKDVVDADTKAELLPACRALDRVIMHSHYLIPQWTLSLAPHRLRRLAPGVQGADAALCRWRRLDHGHLVGQAAETIEEKEPGHALLCTQATVVVHSHAAGRAAGHFRW